MSRVIAAGLILWLGTWPVGLTAQPTTTSGIEVVPGMPPIVDPRNLYSETQARNLSPAVTNALSRVYVPNGVSRLRNRHSDYAYLRAASYQYLGCQYELLMNFEAKGGTLSSIVLTHPGGAKAADQSCREGLSRLREKIGPPMSVSDGVQMWQLKDTTVSVMEGRRGEVQIRYTVTKPFAGVNEERRP